MKSIKVQLIIIITIIAIVSFSALGIMSLYSLNNVKDVTLSETKTQLLLDYDEKIKNLVEGARSILELNHSLYSAGELSLEEAQVQAKRSIREMRYGEDDLFENSKILNEKIEEINQLNNNGRSKSR